MKTKSRYQPSKTVEALFTTAVVKIKADANRVIAKQKAMSETEVASAKAEEVEAKTKEPILEQKVEPEVKTEAAIKASAIEPETESFEQTVTNETKSEAEPVSQKETAETFESEAEQEGEAAEQQVEDADTAFEDVAEEKVELEVETEAAIKASPIVPETESSQQTGTNETKSEAKSVSQKETAETFKSKSEQEAEAAEQETEDAETAFEDVAEEKVEPEVETEAAIKASPIVPETESSEQTGTNETKSEAEPVSQKETAETFESESEQEAEAAEQETEDAETAFEDVAEEKVEITAESQEPDEGEVSKSIRQMAQSQSNQPREQSLAGSGLCAKDVMLKELVWGSPEDSVQQAITKIQRYDSGYLMVGTDGVLEGIVSNSNITWALSPYLRPVFAKWRRPLDDATLQIRIKWIMSKPVHIVKPETPLSNIMGNMCRFGVLCLPVVDQQGKVKGLVTEADIFKVLLGLKSSPGISVTGNEQKEQSTSDHREIESTPTMEPDLVAPV
ncbi:MAG: CBS domain-containing protein [Planctomycetota bacterium]|jgi:CBS domain-containing protein